MTIKEANLEHLPPELKTIFEQESKNRAASQNGLALVQARNGSPSLKGVQNGKETWLHSGYNPEVEGERWAEKIDLSQSKVFIIVGFGLGYHVESLVEKAAETENVKVIAVEPAVHSLNLAMENRDLSKLLANPIFHLIAGRNEAEIHNGLNQKIRIGQFKDVEFHFFYPLFNYFPTYRESLNHLKSFINSSFIDRNTFVKFGYDWTLNSLKNFPYLLKSASANALKGAFKDIPAILVAAGPSLDKNIHLLREAKGKALIVTVGPSLKPVIELGFEPDFVFSIDASLGNAKIFREVDWDNIKSTRLLYVPELHPEIAPRFRDNLFLGMSPYSLPWLDEVLSEMPEAFSSGPSVANYAFDFLAKTGANPLIFIGQDLAFTGGMTHSQKTFKRGKKATDLKGDKLNVPGIDGKEVLTDRAMYAMLTWYNKYIGNLPSDIKVIDATEGGAKIEGTEITSFKEALEQYCNNDYPIEKIIEDAAKNKLGGHLTETELSVLISDTKHECEKAISLSKKGASKSLRFQAEIAGGTYAGKKLQKIYDDIQELVKELEGNLKYKKITALMFQVINRVFDESRAMAMREDKFTREQGLAIAKTYQYFFSQVEEMANIAKEFLQEHVEKRLSE